MRCPRVAHAVARAGSAAVTSDVYAFKRLEVASPKRGEVRIHSKFQ